MLKKAVPIIMTMGLMFFISNYSNIFPSKNLRIYRHLIAGNNAVAGNNYSNAYQEYLEAAKLGNVYAFNALLYNYSHFSQVFDLYSLEIKQRADKGEIFPQIYMGILYYEGISVEKNYIESAKYFNQAALQGEPYAMARLAEMYLEGRGVPQNYAKGIELANASYAQNSYDGEYVLGVILYNGLGVNADKEQAMVYLKNVANKYSAVRPMLFLASIYNDKKSGYYNKELAEQYYQKAVASKDLDSMYALGVMAYERNDLSLAKSWFRTAGIEGHKGAQFLYASILASEKENPNYREAYRFFTESASKYPQAIAIRDAMAKRMTKEQLASLGVKTPAAAPKSGNR